VRSATGDEGIQDRTALAGIASYASRTDAAREGLRDLGYVEGKKFAIELRAAYGVLAAAAYACTQVPVVPYTVDAHVPVTPQNAAWGHLPAARQPVLP
jgi:hypothetical protein